MEPNVDGPVKPSRRYDSSRRQAQARANRRAVLDAARRQFLARGYAATTIAEVAAEAAVSVETVYKAFGNKPGLLKAVVDVSIVGDDEPIPMMEREFVQRNIAEPDPRRKLTTYAEHFTATAPRVIPVLLLVREAAATDAGAADVLQESQRERLTGMAAFARHLADGGHLRSDVSVEQARDLLWMHNSAEVYDLLVLQRRWSRARFAAWMGHSLIAALLPPAPRGSPR